ARVDRRSGRGAVSGEARGPQSRGRTPRGRTRTRVGAGTRGGANLMRLTAAAFTFALAASTCSCVSAGGGGRTSTLDQVRARGFLRCGVSTGVAGFSALDGAGEWHGLDVDVCHAIAAAVFGDATKVRSTPPSGQRR